MVDTVAPALVAGSAEVVAAVEELVALVEGRDLNVNMSRSGVTEAGVLNHWSHGLPGVYHGNKVTSGYVPSIAQPGGERERGEVRVLLFSPSDC